MKIWVRVITSKSPGAPFVRVIVLFESCFVNKSVPFPSPCGTFLCSACGNGVEPDTRPW